MYIQKSILDDLLREVLTQLREIGSPITTSRGPAVECTGTLLELANPLARLSRTDTRGKPFSCLGELLWYLSGTNSLRFIEYYIKKYARESEDGATVYGGYGPRIFDNRGLNQFDNVVQLLKKKPSSRRAAIQIFDAADNARRRKEIPCTCTIQFLIRNSKLDALVFMRSNDAFVGLPHDVFAFTMIQEIVARSLGVGLGTYKHFVGSLHLYDSDKGNASRYIGEGYQSTNMVMPPMPLGDPKVAIESLLKIEELIRTKQKFTLSDYSLDPYWEDLVRMLVTFAAKKENNVMEIRRISENLAHPVYQVYIEAKLEEASNANVKQTQLPF